MKLAPGDCAACGRGPLHGAWKGSTACACSFDRGGLLVCRDCAIACDVVTKGFSQIGSPQYNREAMAGFVDMMARGLRVRELCAG